MRRSTIAKFVLLSLMAASCKETEAAPYYQPRRDAGDDETAGSAAAKPTGKSTETGDTALPPYPEFGDKISKALTPVHMSKSCKDFSSGAVYASIDDDVIGSNFTQLGPNTTEGRVCGYFQPPGKTTYQNLQIRRSDGKALYLLNGYMYEFVPDELPAGSPAAGWPLKNDIKQNPTHACEKPTVLGSGDLGPFEKFLIQPNGKLVFKCWTGENFVDASGKYVGNWGDLNVYVSNLEVDDAGKAIYTENRITVLDNGAYVEVVHDHFKKPKLKVVPYEGGKDCMSIQGGPVVEAARALTTGFLLIVRNACGLQLWRTDDTTIEYLASYWKLDPPATSLRINGFKKEIVNLAVGGMLYFQEDLPMDEKRGFYCTGICALPAFVDGPTSPEPIMVRPWGDGPDWDLADLGG